MKVISLGWGVQSWALCAMSALGMLPKVDAAIHADTTHERAETYAFARKWTPWLEERGIRIITVKAEDGSQSRIWDDTGQTMVPAYTVGEPRLINGYWDYDLEDDGVWVAYSSPIMISAEHGQLRRSCTQRWKVAPIRRWLQANRNGERVEQWIGITLDEVGRMKSSDVQYISNEYSFIEMLDRPWTRGMVMRWLQDNGLEIPVKSSCVICPFHDKATWREIKMSSNGDWHKALEADEVIRDKRPGYKCYLSAERIPLAEVDFRNEEDMGQLSLW
jgi:hypothetical protein